MQVVTSNEGTIQMKEQPGLNKQLNSQPDYEITTLLIQAYPQHRKK